MKPIQLPIKDVLDLHTFQPREVLNLLDDYFSECLTIGITSVRIIHGKGSGILKKKVHSFLKKCPMVVSFKDAPPESGGWGATIVKLKRASANH
jgi:dsDNA-specific endonuclease/ATPase MutS2